MIAPRNLRVALTGVCLLAASARLSALPRPDEPVDPNKRAPISTADAVRPGATPVTGDGVVGGRVIRMSEIPVRRSAVGGERSSVEVRETRPKDVTKPSSRKKETRTFDRRRAADLPANLPRIERGNFQRLLSDYEAGRDPADTGLDTDVVIGGKRVSIGDINQFASPRAAMEAQGIPVTSAGSEAAPAPQRTPVPIPAEKNGNSPSR